MHKRRTASSKRVASREAPSPPVKPDESSDPEKAPSLTPPPLRRERGEFAGDGRLRGTGEASQLVRSGRESALSSELGTRE